MTVPASPDLVVATDDRYVLAEGPAWDPVGEQVLWVDIERGRVMSGRLAPDGRIATQATLVLGETVGAVAVTGAGEWVIAGAERMYLRSRDGAIRPGRRILQPGSGRRLNDGKVDPAGRFLVGTLALGDAESTAEELLLLRAGGLERIDADLTLSNGLAWSPDGGTLFSVDTLRTVVFRRPYDPRTGTWRNRAVHLAFEAGYPDGICADAEDHLWVAMWSLGEVRRYAPDGALVQTVPVPAPHVSSVAFVGPDLETLVITTSNRDLTEDERVRYPGAGALFTVRPGVRGLPPTPCDPACVE
jgi:sugar lactone lactonase YvrE